MNLDDQIKAENSLRTRIVSAIAKADQDWCSDDPLYEDMADAVIEALGLTRVTRSERVPIHRYVTDWETTDD